MFYMKLYKIIQALLIVLYAFMVVFFIYQCLKDGNSSAQISDSVANKVADVEKTITHKDVVVDDNYKFNIRKLIGHFGYFTAFGLVSIFLFISLREVRSNIVKISLHYFLGIGFAFISEFLLEANAKGRTASITDVGIDSLGFVLVSTLVVIIYLIILLIKRKKSDNNVFQEEK